MAQNRNVFAQPDPSQEMIGLYLEYVPKYLNDLNQAVDDQDKEAIRFHSHKLKSAVVTMGFDNIADALSEIEEANGIEEVVVSTVEKVNHLIQHTITLLRQQLT